MKKGLEMLLTGVLAIGIGFTSSNALALTKSPYSEANKIMTSAEKLFKQNQYHSALVYVRDAFEAHPGTNESQEWKDFLTIIYKKRINQIVSKKGYTAEADALLLEIPKYNQKIKDVEILTRLVSRIAEKNERKKYFDMSMAINPKEATEFYVRFGGPDWRKKLKF